MSKLLAALLFALVALTVLMVGRTHGLWFPENISADGAMIDSQFRVTLVVTGLAFIAAQLGLAYAVWRFAGNQGQPAVYSNGGGRVEVAWTILTATVFLALAFMGQRLWMRLQMTSAAFSPNSEAGVHIELVAQQFQFTFRYSGTDNLFGKTAPAFYDDSTGNYAGLDPADPAGRDDIQVPVLIVPQDRLVELTMRSRDVIHNFFVPAMRIKQDIVPGAEIRIRFTANQTGKFEVPCAELCGTGHYKMKTYVFVVPAGDFAAMQRMDKAQFRAQIEKLAKP